MRGVAVVVIALVAASAGASATEREHAAVTRTILPPGQNGSVQFDRNTTDQAKLYDALTPLQGNVTDRDLRRFFKPAPLVLAGKPARTERPRAGVTIRRGATTLPASAIARPLYDYFTLANLYQPCAAYAPSNASSPLLALVNSTVAGNRCAALAAQGLVTGSSAAEQAADALNRLRLFGWEADSDLLQATHYALATLPVALTYANSYAKASVKDNLCGYSFGAAPVAGVPPPLPAANAAQIFGTGNGVPPTAGLVIINNNSTAGAAADAASISPSTGKQDFNIEGAVCLRNLFTSTTSATAAQVRASIDEIKRSGNLRGKPAVIVHGRSDTLVPVNHTSRPYYALNKQVDAASRLAYYEVTNAQHFDAFLGLAGYDTRLVPLHRYVIQGMDIVYNHLKNGTAIPPSQVVRTTPRGGTPGAAPAITAANVPPIQATPAAADTITLTPWLSNTRSSAPIVSAYSTV